jgi:DNA mismatch endonuclease (patch repair protein)
MAAMAPSFKNLRPSSARASRTASKIRSANTKAEALLCRTIWRLGMRFRKNVSHLPGKPDIAFPKERVAVFCDGDFWHGRDWETMKKKLSKGANAKYWLAKIQANRARDKKHYQALTSLGWRVLRFWESDILGDPSSAALQISATVRAGRKVKAK